MYEYTKVPPPWQGISCKTLCLSLAPAPCHSRGTARTRGRTSSRLLCLPGERTRSFRGSNSISSRTSAVSPSERQRVSDPAVCREALSRNPAATRGSSAGGARWLQVICGANDAGGSGRDGAKRKVCGTVPPGGRRMTLTTLATVSTPRFANNCLSDGCKAPCGWRGPIQGRHPRPLCK